MLGEFAGQFSLTRAAAGAGTCKNPFPGSINFKPPMRTAINRFFQLALTVAFGLSCVTSARAGAFLLTGPTSSSGTGPMILLNNGQALVVGVGDSEKAAELYDPNTGTWTNTGSMSVAHSGCSLTLLANGQVLVAGGEINLSGTVMTNGAEIYNPTTGTWTNTGRMTVARSGHSATLLPGGKVLVAGGSGANYGTLLASSELYDPVAGTWTAVANAMHAARESHSAVLLPNGKVLVGAGYEGIGTPAASSEIFDPAAQTWTATTTPLNTARASTKMVLLSNGKVLVAGGYNIVNDQSIVLSSTEIFDPATGAWTTTNSMNNPHSSHTTTLLQSGKVLVAGGSGTADYCSAEVWDPTTGAWSSTSSLIVGRYAHQAVLLSTGKVLIQGGGAESSAELYTDSPWGSWTLTNSMYVARMNHTATLLTNGMVLIVGGLDGDLNPMTDVELFDPANGTWLGTDPLPVVASAYTTTLLSNGKVLVAGGLDSTDPDDIHPISASEVYNPSTGLWTPANALHNARCNHVAVRLLNGKVLVAGGDAAADSAELFDPSTGSWTVTGSLNTTRASGHTATLLPDGKVLVAGGVDIDGDGLADVEIYDPTTGRWTATNSMTIPRAGHTATTLANGQVLVVAGADASGELYNPATGHWTAIASQMTVPRAGYAATLLPNGKVLLTGGNIGGYLSSRCTAEVYDPITQTFTNTGSMIYGRAFHTTTLLTNGLVLAVAGQGIGYGRLINTAEVYQPETQSVSVAPFSLTNLSKTATGAFHFTFANTPSVSFSVFATTNLASSFSSWMFLGAATDSPPGSYQFTDSQATNYSKRFYRVRSP